MKTNIWRSIAVYAILALLLWGFWQLLFGSSDIQQIPYDSLKTMIRDGKVQSLELGGTEIAGTLKDGSKFTTLWQVGADPELIPLLEQNTVSYSFPPPPPTGCRLS